MTKLTRQQEIDIAEFIMDALYRDWDSYTNTYIVQDVTREEGKRRMNPEMYDLATILLSGDITC